MSIEYQLLFNKTQPPNYNISLTPYNCSNCANRWYQGNQLRCVRHNYSDVDNEHICPEWSFLKGN